MKINLHLKNILKNSNINDIISLGGFMKQIYDVQNMINNNQNINFVINDIDNMIKEKKLNIRFYKDIIIEQLINNEKNIIALYDDNLIGFLIINKNLITYNYIKNKNDFNILMNYLEYKPNIILSKEDTIKYIYYIFNNDWHITHVCKNGDFIFNGYTKFEKEFIKEYKKY